MKKSKYIRHYFAVSNTDGIFSIMVKDGDKAIEWFYDKMKNAGEALHIVYERMMAEKKDKLCQ